MSDSSIRFDQEKLRSKLNHMGSLDLTATQKIITQSISQVLSIYLGIDPDDMLKLTNQAVLTWEKQFNMAARSIETSSPQERQVLTRQIFDILETRFLSPLLAIDEEKEQLSSIIDTGYAFYKKKFSSR